MLSEDLVLSNQVVHLVGEVLVVFLVQCENAFYLGQISSLLQNPLQIIIGQRLVGLFVMPHNLVRDELKVFLF